MSPDLAKESTDRNRTSPFAFTGNKFEFRAVGSSSNPSFSVTILNLIVAESLNLIVDEIEEQLKENDSPEFKIQAILSVLQKYLRNSKAIRFSGDNYSEEWVKEAHRRGLPNLKKSPEAFQALTQPKTVKAFENVLSEQELKSRKEIMMEHYALHRNIEANLMVEMFRTQIFPASVDYQKLLATSFLRIKEALAPHQFHSTKQALFLKHFNDAIEESLRSIEELEKERLHARSLGIEQQANAFSCTVHEKMEDAREAIDHLETLMDDERWPLPKIRELLFMV